MSCWFSAENTCRSVERHAFSVERQFSFHRTACVFSCMRFQLKMHVVERHANSAGNACRSIGRPANTAENERHTKPAEIGRHAKPHENALHVVRG